MPLDVPKSFQDLVDDAKRRISKLCPEWTDHNLSDPGITLIELFAYMTEQYIYRLEKAPEKNLVTFLNLLGSLKPPRAAQGKVTFTLSSPLTPTATAITIKAGTEVATARSAGNEITFTTDRDAVALPPTLNDPDPGFISLPGISPAAFALGFKNNLSDHTLAVKYDSEPPPKQWSGDWEVYREGKWTRPLSRRGENGEVEIELPGDLQESAFGTYSARTWVRCTPPSNITPKLVNVETRGITVPVTHAQVIENEVIGTTDGQPEQSFALLHGPILEPGNPGDGNDAGRHPDEWVVEVGSDGNWQALKRVECFPAASDKASQSEPQYRIDPTVEKAVQMRAAIPAGLTVRIKRYRFGGGEEGNVRPRQIQEIKRSLQGFKAVTNKFRTFGGRAGQTLEDFKQRGVAPARERERTRAVTPEDFEVLAREVPGVGRAQCLRDLGQSGQVTLLVTPDSVSLDTDKEIDDYITMREKWHSEDRKSGAVHHARQELAVPEETKKRLEAALEPRLLLGVTLKIEEPEYYWIRVDITVTKLATSQVDITKEVKRRLYRWFHPLNGGDQGAGWRLGQRLQEDKLWWQISSVAGLDHIDHITLYTWGEGKAGEGEDWQTVNLDDPSVKRPATIPLPDRPPLVDRSNPRQMIAAAYLAVTENTEKQNVAERSHS